MKKSRILSLLVAGLLGFSAVSCADKDPSITAEKDPFAVSSEKLDFKIDTLYTDFISPWGMTWLPDGKMLVVERAGEMLIFENDVFTGNKVSGLPAVREINQAGLLDVTLHPDYASNGWIYLAYARTQGDGEVLVIGRGKLSGTNFTDYEDIYVCGPEWKGGRHFGSRIVFDNDGYLFFSNGDKGSRPMNAQELDNDHGKVLRLHDDGRIPADNPFVNEPNAKGAIWSYGNRNIQGMVYDKANNRLWAVEHGPKGGDELNLIEKGKNYGWPVISYGINYDGSILTELTEKEGMEQPVTYWVPSIATCGMALVTSDKYPTWKGNLLVAGLAGMQVARLELDGAKVTHEETLLKDIGRVRQVSQSPDGYIYALVEATGLLVKLIPQS
ncbi:PQQ-dependent sugar dehydrogenase [Mongoliitalea daihaiensis]|uniref:PQQ-dependent sugar dehydrogenase n=1 Tax=Mongoliitalea daihaiensis TaxID=2782006 RepID=UPI001F2DFAC9|nr:PQQ-dependent sugar dehydrogenase [Mongoliitalea daihaiensis]UJP66534.1 PQQ-dependent sugar dehydrogenase [Mongoliitalea daihaiensis]